MSATLKNNLQEYDPRHRLTGAVVLILLAIILLPMLLSKKSELVTPEGDPVVMEITKEGKKVFVSRISSVKPASSTVNSIKGKETPADTKQASSDRKIFDPASSALFRPMTSTVDGKSSSAEKPSTAKSAKKASEKKPAVKKTTSKKTTAKKPTVSTSGWILQVGVFSQSANAAKKVSELKKKGFNATSGKVKTSKGTVTKVWIGPFKDRKSAEKMQDRLQHKTRQRGIVVENKS